MRTQPFALTHRGETMFEQESTRTTPPIVEQGTLFSKEELARLTVKQQRWEATTVRQSQTRIPEREHLVTTSGVPLKRLYTPLDNSAQDYSRDLGFPGEYPYTRGVQ